MLMCCTEEKKFADMSKSEAQAIMEETFAYCEALHKNGTLILSEALEPVEMATTVRVRNGKLSTTDAPLLKRRSNSAGSFSSTPEISMRPFR
jgi:hypothetical protein